MILRHMAFLSGLLLTLNSLHAMGGPPLITDDPDTTGDGHWEINLGCTTDRRPGATTSELPLLNTNYGISERLQLSYEVPYMRAHEVDEPSQADVGNSTLGVRWGLFESEENGLAVSVSPEWEFYNPGSASADLGLVERESAFSLSFQIEGDWGPVTMVAQTGREFRSSGDTWFYGVSAGHQVTERIEIAVELAGEADAGLHRSLLIANLGVVIDLSEHTAFMFAAGRELHNHEEPKATLLGYVGLQWRP